MKGHVVGCYTKGAHFEGIHEGDTLSRHTEGTCCRVPH